MRLTLREAARENGRVVYLELIVLLLSLYSLAALATELVLPLALETRRLLARIDDLVCGVFLADFVVHWWRAPSRRQFLRLGWIDLVSSIPTLEWLRWGRIFRVLRILRALRSVHAVREHLRADRPRGTFAMVGLLSLAAVLFATIAVFEAERGQPGANIQTGGDALWWAFATITTIGYGDRFPVTFAGRVVAVVLVVFGLSFFGTFTAYVASFFLEKTQLKEESEIHHVLHELRLLRAKLDLLDARLPPPPDPSTARPAHTPPRPAPFSSHPHESPPA